MKRIILFVLLVSLLLVGGAFAQADSLNVRHHWSMPHSGYTMVMDSDTNIWFVMPFTDTLVKVDVSNPSAIDTDFFDVDSGMMEVIGIVDDSMLLVGSGSAIRTINLKDNPPSLLYTYSSPHFATPYAFLKDSLIVSLDREVSDGDSCLAFFDVSDPMNIDTFCTGIRGTSHSRFNEAYFASKDSVLYLCYCVDYYFSGDPYDTPYPRIYVSIINIADYRNPIFEGTYMVPENADAPYAGLPAPSVVADSFLYIAANFYDNYDAVVLNISNPMLPTYIGTVGSAYPYGDIFSIAYQNGYLYVGSRIYNISSSPIGDSLVGHYEVAGISISPTFQIPMGSYIYCFGGPFVILDFYEYLQVYEPNNRLPEYEHDFYLSPNPSLKYSNLSFPNPLDGTMDIYNIRGQKMEQIDIKRDKYTYTINLSEYPIGLYLVTYNFGSEKVVKKLVVIE